MNMNYLPTAAPGTSRRRTNLAELHNPAEGTPHIRWREEDQITLADGTQRTVPVGTLETYVTQESLAEAFPLVNPDTGEQIGTMPGEYLLLAIQSYYIHKAKQRDMAVAQTPIA